MPPDTQSPLPATLFSPCAHPLRRLAIPIPRSYTCVHSTDLSKTVPELARRMERMATRYKTLQAKKTGRREKLAVVKRAQTTSMEMRVKNIEAQLHNQGSSIETIKGDVQKILSSLDAIMASTQSQNLMTE